jgi:hypothetical protein
MRAYPVDGLMTEEEEALGVVRSFLGVSLGGISPFQPGSPRPIPLGGGGLIGDQTAVPSGECINSVRQTKPRNLHPGLPLQ